MFNTFFRRFQKFFPLIKVVLIGGSLVLLIYLIFQTSPDLPNLLLFSISLLVFVTTLLSFILPSTVSFAVGNFLAVLLFLKATQLASPINLGLLAVFEVTLLFPIFTKLRKKE